jgi:hypothetical protein
MHLSLGAPETRALQLNAPRFSIYSVDKLCSNIIKVKILWNKILFHKDTHARELSSPAVVIVVVAEVFVTPKYTSHI